VFYARCKSIRAGAVQCGNVRLLLFRDGCGRRGFTPSFESTWSRVLMLSLAFFHRGAGQGMRPCPYPSRTEACETPALGDRFARHHRRIRQLGLQCGTRFIGKRLIGLPRF